MRKDIIGEIKWTSYDYFIARDSLVEVVENQIYGRGPAGQDEGQSSTEVPLQITRGDKLGNFQEVHGNISREPTSHQHHCSLHGTTYRCTSV
ncbi:hypothetical protein XELAEV_18041575mg [Xenopus laevis]|uniref:Uncharacterized protein n=1 Tax=Xenopus laevis TaxID=8355 RepID=A0A974C2E4_XENLA|nr:hypothetical protein XELAEV_18041575mg [Xenopus laevis]